MRDRYNRGGSDGSFERVQKGKKRKGESDGFGDNQFLKAVSEGITTVHFYYKTSGIKAAEMLLDIIEEGHQVPIRMKLGYQIMEH